MKPLVNFNQRSITLPPGCKDLIDLLHPENRPERLPELFEGVPWIPLPKPERITITALTEIEPHILRLLSPEASGATLWLTATAPEIFVMLSSGTGANDLLLSLMLDCAKELGRERAARSFFERQGVHPHHDSVFPNVGLLSKIVSLGYPLPSDPQRAARIITDMLREVYELPEQSALELIYHPPIEPSPDNAPEQ